MKYDSKLAVFSTSNWSSRSIDGISYNILENFMRGHRVIEHRLLTVGRRSRRKVNRNCNAVISQIYKLTPFFYPARSGALHPA